MNKPNKFIKTWTSPIVWQMQWYATDIVLSVKFITIEKKVNRMQQMHRIMIHLQYNLRLFMPIFSQIPNKIYSSFNYSYIYQNNLCTFYIWLNFKLKRFIHVLFWEFYSEILFRNRKTCSTLSNSEKKTEINTPSMAFIFFVCVNMVWAIERTNEFYQFNFHGNLN